MAWKNRFISTIFTRISDQKYEPKMKIKTFIAFTILSFLLVGCPGKNTPPNNNQSEYSKKSMY